MPLVPAECTQCGATLEVDASCKSATCPFCKMVFVTEKAINNYNTNYTTNIGSLHADVVNISDDNSRDNKVKSGDAFIKMGDYKSAYKIFNDMANEHPYDYRSWWGIIRTHTKDFQDIHISKTALRNIDIIYEKMLALSVPDTVKSEFENYKKEVLQNLEFVASDTKEQLNEINQRATLAKTEKENAKELVKNKYLSVETSLKQSIANKNKSYSKIKKISKWSALCVCFILYAFFIFGLIKNRVLDSNIFLTSAGYFMAYMLIIAILFAAYKKLPFLLFIPVLLLIVGYSIATTIDAIKRDAVVFVTSLYAFGGLLLDIVVYKLLSTVQKKRMDAIHKKIMAEEKELTNLINKRNTEINEIINKYNIEKEQLNTQIQNIEKILNRYK